jgi:hypothetical protein
MTTLGFAAAVARTALIVAPAALSAHLIRLRFSSARGIPAGVIEAVLALSAVLVAAELLGLVGGLRIGWLAALLWLLATVAFLSLRAHAAPAVRSDERPAPLDIRSARNGAVAAGLVIWLAVAQWTLSTVNALGGGMWSFDVLWYHMPFAAQFAQTGSVTGIHFTQADPFVAYYPANSELLHAVGIIAFRNDFLSPILNLGWMLLLLVGAWCVGRRWKVEWWTLAAGGLLLALPVLSTTQPGEAFNDVVGLAALVAAVALILAPERGPLELITAGLALGLAAGTKYTFVVPAIALVIGVAVVSPRAERKRAGLLLAVGLAATSAWWYVRALVHTGNPLGLRQTLGPLHLPGPSSPLADSLRQTVLSEVRHTSLWGPRFAPGLAHAFGPLWPVVLLAVAAAIAAALAQREPLLRVVAFAALIAGISYFVFPTGAAEIRQSATLFQVNLRYATPALALGLLLLPIVLAERGPRPRLVLAVGTVLVAVLAQLERNVWPAQTTRHVAFLVATAAALALGAAVLRRPPRRGRHAVFAGLATALVLIGAGYLGQRHYFQQRYLVGQNSSTGIGEIYRWAQTVSHTRIAVYGTVEQYPLYGATDTNDVDYLGERPPHGGYEAVMRCTRWRALLQSGGYRYLVLAPGPTAAPLAWSQGDPDLTPVLHPSPGNWVFEINARHLPTRCTSV